MSTGDRTKHWPAIEKKHGEPIDHWLALMQTVSDRKYDEQIAFLRDNHGFSQAHANAVVMYSRGSTSAKRFDTVDGFLATLDPAAQKTVQQILAVIRKAHPEAETVIAWNQPMVKIDGDYVFGVMATKHHLLIAPWGTRALAACAPLLEGYAVNKKTIRVPLDWEVDATLVAALIDARLAELRG
ncbi:MAG: DUF4287 domain-containing protein [Gaiellales bacterium]